MANERDPERDQQAPVPQGIDVQQALMRAIAERRAHGIRKYGQPLMTEDQRDTLRDAWEEALDLASYLTKALLQRDGRLPTDPEPVAARQVVREHDPDYNDLQTYLEGTGEERAAAMRRLDQRAVDQGQLSPAAYKAVHGALPEINSHGHATWCPWHRAHGPELCDTWGQV